MTIFAKAPHLRQDFAASLVVFLVALPLCVGVAVASGVPAELGLVTGIVGGIVTGLLPGSSLQVSGPAAGLTVLVFEAVREYGLPALGVIVLAAGLLQVTMGALKLGRWFRAISVSVVEGMLAGIGLVIIAGQLYAAAGLKAPAAGLDKIAGLPGAAAKAVGSTSALTSLAVGAGTIAVIVLWQRLPQKVRAVPGPLAAVGPGDRRHPRASTCRWRTVEVKGLLDAVQPPGSAPSAELASLSVIGTVVAFTLIASAESLFSAAAVDRLHDGPRTQYDKELMAQGAATRVCGAAGRAADDRGDRAQLGERPGGRADEGVPGDARCVAAAVRGAAARRAGAHTAARAGGHTRPRRLEAHPPARTLSRCGVSTGVRR